MLGRLVPQELEREIEAQVRVVVEAGIPVTHVDSHRHLHKFQPVRRRSRPSCRGSGSAACVRSRTST